MASPSDAPTGVWFVGVGGNLGVTAILGARAMARGLAAPIGLITETPGFAGVSLPAVSELVFGGHEVRPGGLAEAARANSGRGGFLPADLVEALGDELEQAQAAIRPGTLRGAPAPLKALVNGHTVPEDASGEAAVERLAADIRAFREDHGLGRVIVLNVASTEPLPKQAAEELTELDDLPASSLYAVAAARAGCPYVNFTPSLGAGAAAAERALAEAGLPHCGADGKTGETLVKSALAPLFAVRALDVLSWSGQNLLGNLDGRVLADPDAKDAKVKTKSAVLSEALGYEPESRVGIDFVSSLGDWKVAWDFIHFQGFLGVPMRMQFTWEGCDSILAAPLLLDLARLMAWADARGESGALGWLGVFFKSPMGPHSAALSDQFRDLQEHLGLR